jgi:ADP-ribose pyrophosphatase YjhB (NUDIX family)
MAEGSQGKQTQRFQRRIPEDDDRERLVCDSCGFIAYENPKIVVGSVVTCGGKLLLCRRAIEPRLGYWTLPAGYLENHETPEQGAAREAWEEARAAIEIELLLGVYSIPRISQVQMIYRASLPRPDFAPGPESQEVALFAWDEIPWDDVAFPSVHWALHHWRDSRDMTGFPPFTNPVEGL